MANGYTARSSVGRLGQETLWESPQRSFKASGPDEVIKGVAADLTPCVTRSLSLPAAPAPSAMISDQGDFLLQWLRLLGCQCPGPGLSPWLGTRSHMPQLRPGIAKYILKKTAPHRPRLTVSGHLSCPIPILSLTPVSLQLVIESRGD